MLERFPGRGSLLLAGAVSWILFTLFTGPIGRAVPPSVPADLAPGYVYQSRLAWPGTPIQAVHDPRTGDVVGLDNGGNLSIFAPAGQGYALERTIWQDDPANQGPDLGEGPQGGTVYWVNSSRGTIEALSLTRPDSSPVTLATDSENPQFLTVGPRGGHLYVVNENSLSVLSLTAPAAGLSTTPLSAAADAPAAVYATPAGDTVFLPSAVPSGNAPGGQILRLRVGPGDALTPLPSIPDANPPTSLALSPDGALVVDEGYTDTLRVIAHPLSPTVSGANIEAPTSPPRGSLTPLPGSLFVSSGEAFALGASGNLSPLAMVYATSAGTWQVADTRAVGPWSAAGGTAVSPTGGPGVVLADPGLAAEPLSGALPALLPGSSVQLASGSGGTLWIPTMTGAVSVVPETLAPTTTIADSADPTGGLALSSTDVALADSNPGGIAIDSQAGSALGSLAAPAGDVPLALTMTAGGPAALVSEPSGAVGFWNPKEANLETLPFAANGLAPSPAGPLAVGANSLTVIGRPTVLHDTAFAGPATEIPSGLVLAGSGFGSPLALVNPTDPAILGSIPWAGTPADAGTLAGLALSAGGSRLFALTGQGLVIYRGPSLRLGATAANQTLVVTATLTASSGNPVAGVRVTFSNGAAATTNPSGVAALDLPLPPGPITVSATAPGVWAALSWSPASTSPGTPPPSSPVKLPSSAPPPAPGPTPNPPPTPPPAAPRHASGWRVFAVPPRSGPAITIRVDDGEVPDLSPPGKVLARFQTGVAGKSLYPGRYRLIVVPPPRFAGAYGVWYWSAVAGRWFPLLPSGWSRVFTAAMPYLGAMAVTTAPDPAVESVNAKNRRILAEDLAAIAFPAGAGAALLVNQGFGGSSPVDGLAAAPLAFRWGLPLLLSPARHLPRSVLETLGRLGVGRVTLVGGTKALGPEIEAALVRAEIQVSQPFSGINRRATRAMIRNYPSRGAPVPAGSFTRALPDAFEGPLKTAAPVLIWRGRPFTPKTLRELGEIDWTLRPRPAGSLPEHALAKLVAKVRPLSDTVKNPMRLARAYARLRQTAAPPLVEIYGGHHTAAVVLGQILALRYNALTIVTKTPFPVPLTRFGIPRRPLWMITVGPFGFSGFPLESAAPAPGSGASP